jgi:hypothetical protein
LSPNYFTVRVQSNIGDAVEIKLYDMLGQQVEMAKGGVGESIRVGGGLSLGTYIITIQQGKNIATVKVSKL